MHILFSFIGRSHAGTARRYLRVAYRFADGGTAAPASYIGWALREHFAPDCTVVLGTAGSMWEHLLESLEPGDQCETEREQLLAACEQGAVTQQQLDALQPLASGLSGTELRLRLVDDAADQHGQAALLGEMASHVATGDTVTLDVTHGFRHLPMLALVAALYLRSVRGAQIHSLVYGRLHEEGDVADVIALDGLLHLADWVLALVRYDHSGDYGVFAALCQSEGMSSEHARLLAAAAFYEHTTNAVRARECLMGFRDALNPPPDTPAARLFAPALAERLAWARAPARSTREFALARTYLDRRDPLRAALYAREAVVTRRVESTTYPNPDDLACREEASRDCERGAAGAAARELFALRNALAHGTRPNQQYRRVLADPETLLMRLATLIQTVQQQPVTSKTGEAT